MIHLHWFSSKWLSFCKHTNTYDIYTA